MSTTLASHKAYDIPMLNRSLAYLAGDGLAKGVGKISYTVLVPLIALVIFLGLWDMGARQVQTSLGQLPGPAKVWEQTIGLYERLLQAQMITDTRRCCRQLTGAVDALI